MLEFIAFAVVIYLLYDIRTKVMPQEKSKEHTNDTLVLDTSALIDGRIMDLIDYRLVGGKIVIPKAVLIELQKLADLNKSYDRQRALSGLENVKRLQNNSMLTVLIVAEVKTKTDPVDSIVIETALKYNARICSTDVGLQKLAEAQHCEVLNLNQLASSIRLSVHAGDLLNIKITAKGEAKSQGVGYTDDGVMVIVDQAAHLTGKNVQVVVCKALQTATGQILFAKISRK